MGGLIVTFGIIIVMSILGYLTQALKRAADRRLQERERERARERRAQAALENPTPVAPTRRNELDRYIQAVEAQRAKPVPTARPVVRAAPVPTVQPARKKARTEDVATAFPPAKLAHGEVAPIVPDELPVAKVVTPRGSVPTAAPVLRAEKAATLTPSRSTKSATPVGRQLAALFKSGEAIGLAVVLQEVFGPPKCRQNQPPAPPREPNPDARG